MGRRLTRTEPWFPDEATAERVAWLRAHRYDPVELPPGLERDLQAGRLEKTCPECGRTEAASFYCSGCYRPTGPADWYRRAASAATRQALAAARGRRNGQYRAAERVAAVSADPTATTAA